MKVFDTTCTNKFFGLVMRESGVSPDSLWVDRCTHEYIKRYLDRAICDGKELYDHGHLVPMTDSLTQGAQAMPAPESHKTLTLDRPRVNGTGVSSNQLTWTCSWNIGLTRINLRVWALRANLPLIVL